MLKKINKSSDKRVETHPQSCLSNPRDTTIVVDGEPSKAVGFDVHHFAEGYEAFVDAIREAEKLPDSEAVSGSFLRHMPSTFAYDPWVLAKMLERLKTEIRDHEQRLAGRDSEEEGTESSGPAEAPDGQ